MGLRTGVVISVALTGLAWAQAAEPSARALAERLAGEAQSQPAEPTEADLAEALITDSSEDPALVPITPLEAQVTPPPATQPARRPLIEAGPDLSSDEIAKALQEESAQAAPAPLALPEPRPVLSRAQRGGRFSGSPNRVDTLLLEEGAIISGRRGRIVKSADGPLELAWEREGPALRSPPMRLIPNRLLEQALQATQGRDDIVLEVAGLVTQFEGKNHLLLYRVAAVPNLGNLD